ncbi:MAG: cation:proton antiporter [Candidatus Methanospirareceae archaeon]
MTSFLPLFIIAAFAFVIPILSDRIGIPAAVGEIICGMFLGKTGGFIYGILIGGAVSGLFSGEEEGIAFLASFGFIFLMFLVGLDIDFSQFEVHGLKLFAIGTLVYVLTLGASAILVTQLGYNLYMALLMSTSSAGLVVATIRESGLLKTDFGQTIIISAFIADFATVLLVTIYTIYTKNEFTGEIFLVALVFLLFILIYYIGRLAIWHFPEWLSSWFKSDQPAEIGVRASFALLLVFVVLAEVAGVEAILGAFLAGVMLSLLFRGGTILEQKLYSIGYGFLIPIFFINVGIKFDPGALVREGIYIFPMLILIALIVKIVPSLVFLRKYSMRESVSAGVLLSSRLSLIIALAAVGMELGLIDEAISSAITLVAIITSIVCPTVFKKFRKHLII